MTIPFVLEISESPSEEVGISMKEAKSKNQSQSRVGKFLRDWSWLIIPVLVVVVLRFFIVEPFMVPTGSMENTIGIGERILVNKLDKNVSRGDVIVFRDTQGWLSNQPAGKGYLVKRVIGVGGDEVSYSADSEHIKVNGKDVDESVYLSEDGVGVIPFSVKVPIGYYFVMGDHRNHSADSRYHFEDSQKGLVSENQVAGVVWQAYWPVSRIGSKINHEEVFAGGN